MKPQGCKAVKQQDEWFCPKCGVRWAVNDEDYTPPCVKLPKLDVADYYHVREGLEFVKAPDWASEGRASMAVFQGSIILAHPDHPPMILKPGAKKFVDVTGIT